MIFNELKHPCTVYKPLITSGQEIPKPLQDIINVAEEMNIDKFRQIVDNDAFHIFAEMFLQNIVRKRDWRFKHQRENLRNFVTIADESLALLILENNISEWIDDVQLKNSVENANQNPNKGGNRENMPPLEGLEEHQGSTSTIEEPTKKGQKRKRTLYTHGGSNDDGTKKGWSIVGIKRYNTIMRNVKSFRGDPRYTSVEDELRKMWKEKGKSGSEMARSYDDSVDAEEVEEALTEFDFE